jgi:hypothetical protein
LDNYYVATFHSVSQALRFEKTMLSLNTPVKLIPVPRIISSSCGIAARFSPELLPEVTHRVESGEAELDDVFLFTWQGKKTVSEKITGPWHMP